MAEKEIQRMESFKCMFGGPAQAHGQAGNFKETQLRELASFSLWFYSSLQYLGSPAAGWGQPLYEFSFVAQWWASVSWTPAMWLYYGQSWWHNRNSNLLRKWLNYRNSYKENAIWFVLKQRYESSVEGTTRRNMSNWSNNIDSWFDIVEGPMTSNVHPVDLTSLKGPISSSGHSRMCLKLNQKMKYIRGTNIHNDIKPWR